MKHIISVSAENLIDPNPLPKSGDVLPGDTVTWLITPTSRELQVLFKAVIDIGATQASRPCNPLGLFSSISLGAGLIVGTVHSDPYSSDFKGKRRFVYELYENGTKLATGGIDIPMTPG
jgi:hypothetical protein